MASVKVTITVPEKQLADDQAFRELLKQDLDATGGPMTNEEKEWADALLASCRLRAKSRGQTKAAPGRSR